MYGCVNGDRDLIVIDMPGILWIQQEIRQPTSYRTDGHTISKTRSKKREVRRVVPRAEPIRPTNLVYYLIQKICVLFNRSLELRENSLCRA